MNIGTLVEVTLPLGRAEGKTAYIFPSEYIVKLHAGYVGPGDSDNILVESAQVKPINIQERREQADTDEWCDKLLHELVHAASYPMERSRDEHRDIR